MRNAVPGAVRRLLQPAGRAVRRPVPRGFALIIVLWSIALIAMMVTAVTASGQADVRMAASLRAAAIARAAVDGAVNEAVFRLAAGQWAHAAQGHTLRIGQTAVQVQVTDEAGKVNINMPPFDLMTALLRQIGQPPAQARSLAAAMRDYTLRTTEAIMGGDKDALYAAAGLPYGPPGTPFRTVDELRQVLGMTPDILARLAPYVSAVTLGAPDLAQAGPVVVRAFAEAGQGGGYGPGALAPKTVAVLRITARSLPPAGGAQRSATIRIPGPGVPGPAYTLMSWE